MNDEGIDGYWKQRLPKLLCSSDDEMDELLCKLINDEGFRASCIQKTESFMNSQQQDAFFASALRGAFGCLDIYTVTSLWIIFIGNQSFTAQLLLRV